MSVRWSFCFLWFVLFLNSYGKDVSDDQLSYLWWT